MTFPLCLRLRPGRGGAIGIQTVVELLGRPFQFLIDQILVNLEIILKLSAVNIGLIFIL